MSAKNAAQEKTAVVTQVLVNSIYVAVWIALSGTVIMYNKWILAYYGFPYPITLTMWHMCFSSTLATICVRGGYVPSVNMSTDTYLRAILPIGALFAGTLWLGNAAYLYLSVSFIQMLKALMPVAVFTVGCIFGTESFSTYSLLNMVVVTIGVAVASYGEINLVWIGVLLQLLSVMTESTRLTLVQILLQRRGLSLNPITTMYYIAPASFAFLCVPWAVIEASRLYNDEKVNIDLPIFLSNAAAAFALNMSVFLLIGKTSALTMNIAGVIKDWMLIGLSVVLFKAAVTSINLGGYGLAFAGVCWYNHVKLQAIRARQATQVQQEKEDAETAPQKTEAAPLLQSASSLSLHSKSPKTGTARF